MRNNRVLAVAIASTLSVSSGVALSAQLEHVRDGMGVLDTSSQIAKPKAEFDFALATDTVIQVNDQNGTDGVIYASELFGSSIGLPSGDKGKYAAVIYTIDGQINDEFEMTFTLTNGATFDGDVRLGIKDTVIGSGGVVANVTTSEGKAENNIPMEWTGTPLVGGDIFALYTYPAVLYEVKSVDSKNVAFRRLGTGPGTLNPEEGLDSGVNGSLIPVGVYKFDPSDVEKSVNGANVVLGKDGATMGAVGIHAAKAGDNNSVANVGVENVHNFIEEAYYYFASDTTKKPYKVASKSTKQVTFTENNTAASNFPDGALLRVYTANDTLIYVGNDAAFKADNDYQSKVDTAIYTVTDIGTGNNTITLHQKGKGSEWGLVSNFPAGENGIPMYRVGSVVPIESDKENWKGTTCASLPLKPTADTGTSKSTATFTITADKSKCELNTNDQIMLLYKLGNTKALSVPGEQINLEVSLKTRSSGKVVNPSRKITVATSKAGVKTAEIRPIDGNIKISVVADSKEFTGSDTSFISTTEASIGYLDLAQTTGVKTADGFTDFEIGGEGASADKSTLVISGGQFTASLKKPKGKVYINADGKSYEADTVTETEATWNLQDATLRSIAEAPDDQTYIQFVVDGETAIEVPENPPTVTLTLDFADTTTTDMTIDSTLLRIKKDGTICQVYNVPNSAASDILSIRVTNDSSSAGKLTATLYDMEGTAVIAAGTELFGGEEIQSLETKRITAADLETLAGAAWTGRARLVISSTLPKLEVLPLLRQNVPGAPLTNQSLGASGKSCNND